MGAKENDVQFIVNGESHKLRCAKDDPSKVDVYESHVHDDDDSSAEQPLFDPYTNLLYPAADIAIQNKYYVPKQLNEDTKQLVAKKSAEAEKEFRPSKSDATLDAGQVVTGRDQSQQDLIEMHCVFVFQNHAR